MSIITLRFAKSLDERRDFHNYFGVRFHRWLPDGENDAITVESEYSGVKVKLWFQRFGYVERGMIEYNQDRKEVDPTIMIKQGLLESGPLYGKIESFEITDDELQVLEEKRIDDAIYQELGKRIAKTLDPILVKFFYVMRIHFGQYWLPEFEKFNSEKESIGHHLRFLFMTWSKDEGKTWEELKPDNDRPVVSVYISSPKSFITLMTETDWKNLQVILGIEYKSSLAAITLARTHQYLEEKDARRAIIEGSTALELAIEEFVKTKLDDNATLNANIQGFWNLPIGARFTSIAITLEMSKIDIENTLTAIKWRNKIVHDGWEPEFYPARVKIISLLHTTARLLNGPEFKFPDVGGNAIMSVEAWEKEYRKSN
jgi:hypothetical protein